LVLASESTVDPSLAHVKYNKYTECGKRVSKYMREEGALSEASGVLHCDVIRGVGNVAWMK